MNRSSLRRNSLAIARIFLFSTLTVAAPFTILSSVAGAQQITQQTGFLEITAHVSPTGGHAEPARALTVYVLRKSYAAIQAEADAAETLPKIDEFVAKQELSPELKSWMVKHQMVDLSGPAFPKTISPDDVLNIPEFKEAYMNRNSGDRTVALPQPKAREADKQRRPEKYQQAVQDYLDALKRFIAANPDTLSTMYVALEEKNPGHRWNKILADRKARVHRRSLQLAQTQYLAGQTDTDLEGHGRIDHLQPGDYWLSTLDNEAIAGDARIRWDVPFHVVAGRSAAELSNVNGVEPRSQ